MLLSYETLSTGQESAGLRCSLHTSPDGSYLRRGFVPGNCNLYESDENLKSVLGFVIRNDLKDNLNIADTCIGYKWKLRMHFY